MYGSYRVTKENEYSKITVTVGTKNGAITSCKIQSEGEKDLLTDAIRALVLEDRGYAVDMIEFTDFDSTPKNLMIRAKRTGKTGCSGRAQARALAGRYGFTQTLLELERDEKETSDIRSF